MWILKWLRSIFLCFFKWCLFGILLLFISPFSICWRERLKMQSKSDICFFRLPLLMRKDYLFFYCLFVVVTQTQDLKHVRQILYHWTISPVLRKSCWMQIQLHSKNLMAGQVPCTHVIPATQEDGKFEGSFGNLVKLISKGLEYRNVINGRTLAQHVQGPKFNTQYCPPHTHKIWWIYYDRFELCLLR